MCEPCIQPFETNMSSPRPVILCFVKYYLPGYRSGGPLRTIVNFIEHFGDEFDIRIVTTDRDVLDTSPYPDVAVDSWNTVGKAQVFYASQKVLTLRSIARLKCSPKIGQLVKLAKTLKPSSQHEAEAQKIQPRV